MASVSTTHTFECSAEQLFYVITDYESYHEFLPEIETCKVIKEDGDRKLVEYTVSVIKHFTYRLWMEEDWENKTVRWSLDSGDLFRQSDGSWTLEQNGDQCEATYSVDAKAKMFVPAAVIKTLMSVNLPAMMKAYEKRLTEVRYE